MATNALARRSPTVAGGDAVAAAAYALGALSLAGEGAVHVQQYASLLHEVRWIGPLFLANAAASVVTIIGLAYGRTRALAALAGVVISALALGSLQRHRPPAAPAAVDPVVQASRQAAVSRCGSFQPGRGKWQV